MQQLRLMETVLDTITEAALVADTEGHLIFANKAARQVLGGAGVMDLPLLRRAAESDVRDWHGRPVPPEATPLVRALRGETIADLQLVLRRVDGAEAYVVANATPVRDEQGGIVGAVLALCDLTKRRQAEQLLRQSTAELRAVFQALPDLYFRLDADGTIVDCKAGRPADLYLQRAEFLGKRMQDVLPREVGDQFRDAIRRARETGSIVAIEYTLPVLGRAQVFEARLVPLNEREMIAVVRNVTERKRAHEERERLLREIDSQRQLFQGATENAPAGIAILSGPDLIFELVNPAFQAFAPTKPMRGLPLREACPELIPQVLPILEQVLRTGAPYRACDLRLHIRRSPEGPLEETYFTFSCVPVPVVDGLPKAVLVVAIETTEEVQARHKVEHLAEVAQWQMSQMQAILDSMVDGVFVVDAERRITLANDAGAHLLGFPGVEEVKRNLAEFPSLLQMRHLDGTAVKPEELPLVRALTGQVVVREMEIIRNPRTQRDVYICTNVAPIRDKNGKVVGAVEVARDATELTEIDRLKDQFISMTSHEMKTPVAIMKGYAQALLRPAEEVPPRQRRMLEAIARGSDRIDRVVRDLLDISRLHIGHLDMTVERIDLPELVEQVVDRTALTTTKHNIRVVQVEPVVVQGDRDRLEQVVIHLLDNAIKYSPRGGTIDVAVTRRDGEAVVSVRDYGVGIPTNKQERIFERFYSAHIGTPFDYGGMGVGLYISKEIVSRHGGRMWFESEEGRGSTFYFALPVGTA